MSKRYEIVLSGVGGQGLISCGNIICEAAVNIEKRFATLTSAYGSETRGTFAKSDVIISDERIMFSEATSADITLCLAQVAYNRYEGSIKEGSLFLFDSELVKGEADPSKGRYSFPFTSLALEMGSEQCANLIALGFICGKTGFVSKEAISQAISRTFESKPKVLEVNLNAFNKGLELAENV